MTYSKQLLDKINAGDFSQDQNLLKLALDNDSSAVLASLAENLTDLGITNLAKDVYRALIAKKPKEDLFRVYLAEILLNDGNDDDGLSLLYAVKQSSPAYLDSLLVQADYYQTNGLLEVARAKLLRAKEIAPHEDAVLFGLAELDYLTGDLASALALYRDLLTRQNNFGEVNLNQRIFACLAKMGDYEGAAAVIKEHEEDLIDIDSKYEAGLVLLASGDSKKAIIYLEDVIKQQPDYVNAYPLLAQAYQHEKDTDQVLRIAQVGLAYNELDESLYSMGASAASKLDDLKTAQKLLEQGIKVAPDNSDLRLQLSNLYLQKGDWESNIKLWQKIASEDLEPQAHWNLASSYEKLENTDQAQSEYLLAYPDFKDNKDFLRQMIIFFKSQPQAKTVLIELLHRYLKLVPDDSAMQDLLDENE